jgi:peptide deformylase
MTLDNHIWTTDVPVEEKFLRKKVAAFDFSSMSYKQITELTRDMRRIMREANGVGLSANQIGLPYAVFVAEVQGEKGPKFYSVFNPKIEKANSEKVTMEEGCLSVPGTYGDMTRAAKVTLLGQDAKGRPVKIKAWGLLARVFQHETDHLSGALFIDKCKQTYHVTDVHS